jgi:hypothetical protein
MASKKIKKNTYNSGDSLVVTHPTTNPPIQGLCMAERTGCPVLLDLWSYVPKFSLIKNIFNYNYVNTIMFSSMEKDYVAVISGN